MSLLRMNEDNPRKGLEYATKRKILMKFPGSWRLWVREVRK